MLSARLLLMLVLAAAVAPAAQVTTTVEALATDDGQPDPERGLTYAWTVLEAPAGAQVGFQPSAEVARPSVTFQQPGRYVLGVAVDDGHLASGQTLEINVLGGEPVTPAPSASAPGAGGGGGGGCGGGSALAFLVGWLALARRPVSRASAVPGPGTSRRP